MSDDYEFGWNLKVEEMTETEVNGFIRFLNVSPSPIYNFENRLNWMLVPEVRDELTQYCFRLEVRSRASSVGSPPSINLSEDDSDDASQWKTVSSSKNRTANSSNALRSSEVIEISSSDDDFTVLVKPHYQKLSQAVVKTEPVHQHRKSQNIPKRRFIVSDSEDDDGPIRKQPKTEGVGEQEAGNRLDRKDKKGKGMRLDKSRDVEVKEDSDQSTGESKKKRVRTGRKGSKKSKGGRNVDGLGDYPPERVAITRQEKVDRIVELAEVPTYYPDPPHDMTEAFLVDLSQGALADTSKSMDQVLRDADMDSWGLNGEGTSHGSSKPAKGTKVPILSKKNTSRRRKLSCEGALFCERFDFDGVGLGEDYVREVVEGSEALLPGVPPTQFVDENDVLAHVLLLCRIHFKRNLRQLRDSTDSTVTDEDMAMFTSILWCDSEEKVIEWKQFCSGHRDKRVRDWYANKEMHEGWLLPALNPYYTRIRPDWFKLARKETNIVESQHAHTNRQTRTQLPLLIAIENAKEMDKKVLADIITSDKLGIQANRQNSDLHRLKRQQQLLKSQKIKNDAKRELEVRKEENLKKAEDLKRQLAEVAEERRKLLEEAKKKPQRVYGRSHPPLRPNGYASSQNPPAYHDVGVTNRAPAIPNLPSAYDEDMVLDASQLTQVMNNPTADESAFGMFTAPADYLPDPLSQFHGNQSLEEFNPTSLYRHWE